MIFSADSILEILTRTQFVHPRMALGEVLSRTIADGGTDPSITRQALDRLNLDPTVAVGRLRRTEITQLARVLHRLCKTTAEQPAQA